MATPQTAATQTGSFTGFIKPEMSPAFFDEAAKSSTVMQLARKIPVSPGGNDIPFITSKPKASWVAEGAEKPTTEAGLGLKHLVVKKIAAISVMSNEVLRADPGNYTAILRAGLAESIGIAFDEATLHGINSPFGANSHVGATTKTVALGTATADKGSVYGDVVAGLDALVKDGKKLTSFAFDKEVEPLFLGSLDTAGRPLFVDAPPLSSTTQVVTGGRLIGRPAFLGDNIKNTPTAPAAAKATLGFGGDFYGQCVWGTVGGISWKVSTETTININGTPTSMFQHNMTAILCEAEFGWLCNDVEAFVKYTSK